MEGYGFGMNAKRLHVGFLGQDMLLVRDEARSEPVLPKPVTAAGRQVSTASQPWPN
jgi:hypothetical protein